jgi:glycosyltransferase involved in cell wall biosynthesis
LIHTNEITAILPARLAKALFQKPLVVHVRSVQQATRIPLRRGWLISQLRRHADAVIAIDATVRASLPDDLDVEIVHNAFSPASGAESPEQAVAVTHRFHAGSLRVGMVGNLLEFKGVYDLLRAAELCAKANANVEFLIVGSNPRQVTGFKGALLRWLALPRRRDRPRPLPSGDGLGQSASRRVYAAHRCGYQALDVLCFPSHLDAVGRPVLEAACFGVPSVVAVDRPSPDTDRRRDRVHVPAHDRMHSLRRS